MCYEEELGWQWMLFIEESSYCLDFASYCRYRLR